MIRNASRPFLSNSRQFAVAATATQTRARPEISTGKLSNGLKIGTYENHGPVSTLSIVVNASSRFETPDNFGVSHFLRLFGFKGVHGRTQLKLTREFDNHGGNLTITSNREKIVYTAEFLRGDLPLVIELLSGVISSPEYVLHELNDVKDRVVLDLDQLSSNHNEQVFELLHKVAFRQGLGNSNYAPKINLGNIKSKTLHDYTKKHFVSGNIAVVGAGVNFHDLEGLASSYFSEVAEGQVAPTAAKYYGGEYHTGRLCGHSRVAVGFGTEGLQSKDKVANSVISKILGGVSTISYGNGTSLLSKVAGKSSIEAFSINYSDAGLLGFFVKAPHNSGIQQVVEQALAQIHGLANNVSEADLTRGKNQAKMYHLSMLDKGSSIASVFGKKLLSGDKLSSEQEVASVYDQVTASDVQKAAANLLRSTPTVIVAADDY